MAHYVALLRGINVGGITITMADLREVFAGLGFEKVRTVLASGNVVFDSGGEDPAVLKAEIEAALGSRFGYEAFVFVLDRSVFATLADDCPFADREGHHTYVVFVADAGVREELLAVEVDRQVESIAAGDGVLYWQVLRGATVGSAFGKATNRARYRAVTTTRNIRTVRRLQG